MATGRNHFISVSRGGKLVARRIGEAPVEVACGSDGLEVAVPDGRLAVSELRVYFAYERAAPRRAVSVTEVEVAGARYDVDAFLDRFGVADEELARWMRAAVDRALDRALDARAPGA